MDNWERFDETSLPILIRSLRLVLMILCVKRIFFLLCRLHTSFLHLSIFILSGKNGKSLCKSFRVINVYFKNIPFITIFIIIFYKFFIYFHLFHLLLESFYSSLNMENIDDIDYRHGNNVFKTFKLKNLGEYHDLYVQSDTLLLADVFENFRNMCIKVYELDPAHFLSLPGLAWQACLKKANVKLELLTDYDILLMVEEGIRGGICHSIHRYAKANNKYMKDYDKNKESSYNQYLDANNLYGWAMSQKLLVNNFKWINNVSKINEKFIKNYDEDSDKGYIFEVDVNYPKRLHDLHSDLPFLPERMKIGKCKKLVCNLRDKKRYVLRIRSLKQALDYGLKLEKIQRVIEFNQKSWLKPNIDMNTELRKIAKNDFEKDFFKLMNNAVFGKTMENVRKHRDIKLVTTDKKRSKLVSEPNYHTINYILEDLSIIEMKRTKVKMNKPIY